MSRINQPHEIVERIGIQPGQVVADLGSGRGMYTFAAAEQVGPTGRVYAVDIRPELVESVQKQAKEQHLLQVSCIHADLDVLGETGLRDGLVDVAIVAHTLFQLHDRPTFFEELRRILKPGGIAAVVDWSGSHTGVGPHPDHVIAEKTARELSEFAGFEMYGELVTGEFQYGFLIQK